MTAWTSAIWESAWGEEGRSVFPSSTSEEWNDVASGIELAKGG